MPVCTALDHRHQPLLLRQCDDDDLPAVVFLYSPKTMLAAISIVQLDEAGAIGSAAAMAADRGRSGIVTLLSFAAEGWLLRRTQGWRRAAPTR